MKNPFNTTKLVKVSYTNGATETFHATLDKIEKLQNATNVLILEILGE